MTAELGRRPRRAGTVRAAHTDPCGRGVRHGWYGIRRHGRGCPDVITTERQISYIAAWAVADLLPRGTPAGRLWCVPEPIRVIPPDALVDADPTPGMRRQRAIDAAGLWSGLVHTEPGATSGWHHHGDHETSLYVVSGTMRLEFGPGGRSVVEAGPGEFVHVPAHLIHRESNPADQPSMVVIARAGTGKPTVNVVGPDMG
jgi:uncharacterized RmlC-like cupin family protein